MVQAQGPRREHRPRPRVARARAAPPGADVDRGGRAGRRSPRSRRQYNYDTLDDFYAAIGYGAISAQPVVMRLGVVDDARATLPTVAPPQTLERTGGVRVKGVGDLLVRFAKCCHPIPGDPIVGFITRGKGVTVHLQTCPTVVNEREVSRLIEVEWEAAPTETYPIAIRVEAYDRTGLLTDITQVVAENKVNIVAAHVGVTPGPHGRRDRRRSRSPRSSQLARVMSRIETAQGRHQRPARPRLGQDDRSSRRGHVSPWCREWRPTDRPRRHLDAGCVPPTAASPPSPGGCATPKRTVAGRPATITALAERDWTVAVDVDGLEPGQPLQYGFEADGSVVAGRRTRTLPPRRGHRSASAGVCAKFNAGFFNAYARLAERDDLDFLLHLGDYIYEASNTPPKTQTPGADIGRPFDPLHECMTLDDYRTPLCASTARDPDIQAAARRASVHRTLDDHEFADGAWRDGADNHDEPATGRGPTRTADAFRARGSGCPIRRPTRPTRAGCSARVRFGASPTCS